MNSLESNQQNLSKSSSSSSSSMSEEDEAFSYALYLRCAANRFGHVLDTAIHLGLFDIIAKAGEDAHMSSTEIASQLNNTTNPEAASLVDRMLRLLACHNLVTCISQNVENDHQDHGDGYKVERLYGLALPGKAFVRDQNDTSLAAFTAHKANTKAWLHLKDMVLEGGNIFEKVNGMPLYKYMSLHPEMAQAFNTAMTNLSKIIVEKVLETYRGFEGITTLVDVGGGYGITLNMILYKYPSIKGINYDMPHVIQEAPSYPGIEHIGGDMFSNVPKADAIFVKDILHNWNDKHCLKLLKSCYEALPEKGKLIVVSFVMFEEPKASSAAKFLSHMDLFMALTFHDGAKQRTENQFKAMAKAAGFSGFQHKCRIFNVVGVMEFHK